MSEWMDLSDVWGALRLLWWVFTGATMVGAGLRWGALVAEACWRRLP
ncbi:hypothetical protein [Xanthobacter sediminis]